MSSNFERPLATVDVVMFTAIARRLHVLLVQRPGGAGEPYPERWALPGGFVDVSQDASLVACAKRKLLAKAGVSSPYLEQLGTWGDGKRDPRGWCITTAYYALVPTSEASLRGEPDGAGALVPTRWVALQEALKERLAFDHREILQAAIARLRGKAEYTSLPAFLLPEPFTLPQLQQAYEIVLERPLDKSAFRKRMLDAQFLKEDGEVPVGAGARTAQAYRLRSRREPVVFPRMFRSAE